MTDMNQTALLAAITETPGDGLPRLAYADWLEEHGDDDRANFIRAQVEMAVLSKHSPSWCDLHHRATTLAENHPEWSAPLKALGCHDIDFERGFPAAAQIGIHDFLKHAPALCAEPNLRITVDTPGTGLETLAQSPFANQLSGLHVSGEGLGNVAFLARSPEFGTLSELSFLLSRIGNDGMQALAQSSYLTNLTSLALPGNGLGPGSMTVLAGSANFAHLRRLELQDNALGSRAGVRLARSKHLGHLTRLNLHHTSIDDAVIRALAAPSCRIQNLHSLHIGKNPVSEAGIKALAASPNFRQLRELDLSGQSLTNTSRNAGLIAGSPHLSNLVTLGFNRCTIVGDESIKALADSPFLQNISRLFFSTNNLSDNGAETLARSPKFASLTHLDLAGNHLTDKGAMALAASPHLTHLKSLNLVQNRLTDQGALALVKGLPNLPALGMQQNQIGFHTRMEITRILETRRQAQIQR